MSDWKMERLRRPHKYEGVPRYTRESAGTRRLLRKRLRRAVRMAAHAFVREMRDPEAQPIDRERSTQGWVDW